VAMSSSSVVFTTMLAGSVSFTSVMYCAQFVFLEDVCVGYSVWVGVSFN
jgi:hypothetical protein